MLQSSPGFDAILDKTRQQFAVNRSFADGTAHELQSATLKRVRKIVTEKDIDNGSGDSKMLCFDRTESVARTCDVSGMRTRPTA
jgi:hypothetical protein